MQTFRNFYLSKTSFVIVDNFVKFRRSDPFVYLIDYGLVLSSPGKQTKHSLLMSKDI